MCCNYVLNRQKDVFSQQAVVSVLVKLVKCGQSPVCNTVTHLILVSYIFTCNTVISNFSNLYFLASHPI